MMNSASFRFVIEKIQRNTDRNTRLVKRMEIKSIESSALQLQNQLDKQLETAGQLGLTANAKLMHHQQITAAIFKAN